jgi:hypothetical protein
MEFRVLLNEFDNKIGGFRLDLLRHRAFRVVTVYSGGGPVPDGAWNEHRTLGLVLWKGSGTVPREVTAVVGFDEARLGSKWLTPAWANVAVLAVGLAITCFFQCRGQRQDPGHSAAALERAR